MIWFTCKILRTILVSTIITIFTSFVELQTIDCFESTTPVRIFNHDDTFDRTYSVWSFWITSFEHDTLSHRPPVVTSFITCATLDRCFCWWLGNRNVRFALFAYNLPVRFALFAYNLFIKSHLTDETVSLFDFNEHYTLVTIVVCPLPSL